MHDVERPAAARPQEPSTLEPKWLKPIAAILIAYGAAGLVMAVILLVVGLQLWPVLQLFTTQVSATLRTTAVTLSAATSTAMFVIRFVMLDIFTSCAFLSAPHI